MSEIIIDKKFVRLFDPCKIIEVEDYFGLAVHRDSVDEKWLHFNPGDSEGIPCWKFVGHFTAQSDNLEDLVDEWLFVNGDTFSFFPTLEKPKSYMSFSKNANIYGIIRDPREPSIFTLVCKLTEDGLEVLDYQL